MCEKPGQRKFYRCSESKFRYVILSKSIDLRNEPVVVVVPPITDRYYSFEFLDAYTNDYAYLDNEPLEVMVVHTCLLGWLFKEHV